ncbi:hypothetical protein [Cupriavidus sp. 8B]
MNKLQTTLRIGLSSTYVALVRSHGWLRPRRHLLMDRPLDAGSAPHALQGLRTALADTGCARMDATVVLGNEWVRLFMVTPPHNAERLRDCHAAMTMRFQQLYGEPPSDWHVRADWDAQHPFLACAVPQALLDGLQQAVADHRLALVAIQPQFIAAWNRWRHAVAAHTWFGVVDAQALSLGVIDQGRLAEVRRLPLPPAALDDPAWLSTQLAREALRQTMPAPDRVCLCGWVPEPWLAPQDGAPACVRLDGAAAQASAGAELALTGARP